MTSTAQSHPNSRFARAARANLAVLDAWAVRTGERAEHVSGEQFQIFHTMIAEADRELADICVRHPDFATPWAIRVTTARALQVDSTQAWGRYRRHAELSSHDLAAQQQMLQYLCPKWFGSTQEAAEFARTSSARAPAGSGSQSLVPLHHIEQWVERFGSDAADDYIARQDVQAEIAAASDRFLAGGSAELDPGRIHAHSAFAMAAYLAGDYPRAHAHFEALGGIVSEFPWVYGFQDAAAVQAAREYTRQIVGAGGGRAARVAAQNPGMPETPVYRELRSKKGKPLRWAGLGWQWTIIGIALLALGLFYLGYLIAQELGFAEKASDKSVFDVVTDWLLVGLSLFVAFIVFAGRRRRKRWKRAQAGE